jgi:DHA2 family multidrug resistance protein
MQPQPSLVEYGTRRTLIVIGVMAATLLQVLDATIVNVALPTIQGNLGATLDEGTWIITGYIIAAVIVIPLTPWLQMRFGRMQYYVAAILGFTLTSALCGISNSLWELVFFRVLQGFCGGGLIATGQAILRDTFPPEQIGRSQALISLGAVVGPSIGPTLGGILTDAYSWNWIFYINVLPGLAAALLIATTLRNPAPARKVAVDGAGLSLLALGLGSLQYVLNEGERNDWFNDDKIVALAFTSIVSLAAFTWWELFGARQPVVDLRILRNRTVAAGCALGFTLGFSLFGGIILAPQFNQSILGFTATLSGESILIRALAILAGTPLTLFMLGRLNVNPRFLLASGFLTVVLSYVLQAQVTTSTADFWTFWFPLALGGFGFSQLFVPLLVTVLSSVQGLDTAKASALVSLSQQLGGSISTAAVVTVLAQRDAWHYSTLAEAVTLRNPAVAGLVQQGAHLGNLYRLVVQQAATLAYADAFLMVGFVTLCLTPCVLLLRSRRATVAIQLPAE